MPFGPQGLNGTIDLVPNFQECNLGDQPEPFFRCHLVPRDQPKFLVWVRFWVSFVRCHLVPRGLNGTISSHHLYGSLIFKGDPKSKTINPQTIGQLCNLAICSWTSWQLCNCTIWQLATGNLPIGVHSFAASQQDDPTQQIHAQVLLSLLETKQPHNLCPA